MVPLTRVNTKPTSSWLGKVIHAEQRGRRQIADPPQPSRAMSAVPVTKALDPAEILARILTDHGPLHEADIARLLHEHGVTDPDAVIADLLDEMSCPAELFCLTNAGFGCQHYSNDRVFTHRLGCRPRSRTILLTVTPNLHAITELCEHEQYQQLADGSPIAVVCGPVRRRAARAAKHPVRSGWTRAGRCYCRRRR